MIKALLTCLAQVFCVAQCPVHNGFVYMDLTLYDKLYDNGQKYAITSSSWNQLVSQCTIKFITLSASTWFISNKLTAPQPNCQSGFKSKIMQRYMDEDISINLDFWTPLCIYCKWKKVVLLLKINQLLLKVYLSWETGTSYNSGHEFWINWTLS